MRIAAFVQARMASERLPGKTMLPVWGDMPLIELVLRRVRAAGMLDDVILLTTRSQVDDSLVSVADGIGVAVFRGAEKDVLGRFAAALTEYPVDAVVRVCADNPFVDPNAIDQLVDHFEQGQPCDYASNLAAESGLPDGAGAEIVARDPLEAAAREAIEPHQREHVTAFLLEHPGRFRLFSVPPAGKGWPRLKLDIDTADDYEVMRKLASRLPTQDAPLWTLDDVVSAYELVSGNDNDQSTSSHDSSLLPPSP